MPQLSLLSDRPDVGLRLTITDHVQELDDAITISVEVRQLDGDWATLTRLHLAGRGRDMLASIMEDLTYAWHYEDRRAVVREAQRDQRLATKHARQAYRAQ